MKQGSAKGRRGQLPFVPTERERTEVEAASSFGISHEHIAAHFKISLPTFYKVFKTELAEGHYKAGTAVSGKIYELAMRCPDPRVQLDAAKWFTARRLGWAETNKLEHTGKNGGVIRRKPSSSIAVSWPMPTRRFKRALLLKIAARRQLTNDIKCLLSCMIRADPMRPVVGWGWFAAMRGPSVYR